jgi:hypothetical protein
MRAVRARPGSPFEDDIYVAFILLGRRSLLPFAGRRGPGVGKGRAQGEPKPAFCFVARDRAAGLGAVEFVGWGRCRIALFLYGAATSGQRRLNVAASSRRNLRYSSLFRAVSLLLLRASERRRASEGLLSFGLQPLIMDRFTAWRVANLCAALGVSACLDEFTPLPR